MVERFNIAMIAACPFPYPRGTPIRIYRMAEALVRIGHNVHVITYHLGKATEPSLFRIHRIKNIPTFRKLTSGPTYQKLLVVDASLALKLRRILVNAPFDLIHAHHYEGLLVAKMARIGHSIPIIFDAHTLLESELHHYKIGLPVGLKIRIGHFLDRHLPKWADHIISVTDGIRNRYIQHGFQYEKITVIPNGIEFDHFDRIPDSCLALGSDFKTLAYAGNTDDFQGVDQLLKAFQIALQHKNELQLMIVTQSSFEKYRPLAQRLNIWSSICIVKADFEVLPSYLAKADILLNPRTDCDGYPVKLLNYMASGKPIVTFEGSAKNIIHGINGWIVKDGDIDAFAGAILMLLEKPILAQSLGITAKEHSSKMYTWQAIAQKLDMVYKSLLDSWQM